MDVVRGLCCARVRVAQFADLRPDVDVVADAGAVGGGIVVPKHGEMWSLAHRHLLDVRHQVVRDPLRVLADHPRRVRAHRVEVAQQAHVPLGPRRGEVAEDLLVEELRVAVRVRRPRREALGHGHRRRIAVHGRRRREDDVADAGVVHRLEQVERSLDVDLVVHQRLRDALAHCLQPGEVDHRADGVLREDGGEALLVADVDVVKATSLPAIFWTRSRHARLELHRLSTMTTR